MKTPAIETYIADRVAAALQQAFDSDGEIVIERPRQESFGDFATTSALALAKTLRMPPRKIAEGIIDALQDPESMFESVTVDGPGFINFSLSKTFWLNTVREIFTRGDSYGDASWGNGRRWQIEFVSANPTGPLNVVSARAAAVGDVLVSLFRKVGFDAEREFYINDAGRQIRLLGASVSARYMTLCGHKTPVPEDGYQGEYVADLAREILAEEGDSHCSLDEEARATLLAGKALEKMIGLHKAAMEQYRVSYDIWFQESGLREDNAHLDAYEQLKAKEFTYEKDGAVWFRSSEFGDEKDRVLITREGEPTYFLVDIAYHQDKFKRGFEKLFDLWGPDHHGYIPRMSAALQALGHAKDAFVVRIIQQVNMLRGGEVVKMSKRAGNIVEMREVVDEVGVDAARFFFVMRRLDSPLDFDIDLAKKQTDENPVYYVQYAHARLHSILKYASENDVPLEPAVSLDPLGEKEELTLIKKLAAYPETISKAAELLEPHRLTTYLMELASVFHSFYQNRRVVTEDRALSMARLTLVDATRAVIKNGLALLKIDAPERM